MFDTLTKDQRVCDNLLAAVAASRYEILATHVQRDEGSAIPHPNRRAAWLATFDAISPTMVPTSALILGISRLGHARLTDERGSARIDRLRKDNPKHSRDALMSDTARLEGAIFVTADRSAVARHRAEFTETPAWLVDDLRAALTA